MDQWVEVMGINRCGLGHTAANPVISILKNFRYLLEEKIIIDEEFVSLFNMEEAVSEANDFVGRTYNHQT
jgi:hypothetical protein